MAKVYCDIDETIYPFSSLARQVWSELAHKRRDDSLLRGAYVAWQDWRSPKDVCGSKTWQEVIDICHSDFMILSRVPYKGAPKVIRRLSNSHDVVFITNRNQKAKDATAKWLDQWGFQYKDLICTTDDKQEFMSDGNYLFDDRPKSLIEFVYNFAWQLYTQPKRKGFALLTDYNRNLTDVPNIYIAPSWWGIEKQLEKEEIIG